MEFESFESFKLVTVVPVHIVESMEGSGDIAPLNPNPNFGLKLAESFST